jgi:predicted deacetylase
VKEDPRRKVVDDESEMRNGGEVVIVSARWRRDPRRDPRWWCRQWKKERMKPAKSTRMFQKSTKQKQTKIKMKTN